MLLRRNPNVAIAPSAEFSELLHLLVCMLHVILDGEPIGVIYTNITPESKEDAGRFEGNEPGV